jgi:hypothetical protein
VYNRTRFGVVRREKDPKSWEWVRVRGKTTDSRSEVVIFSRPPMSTRRVKYTSSKWVGPTYRKSKQLGITVDGECGERSPEKYVPLVLCYEGHQFKLKSSE